MALSQAITQPSGFDASYWRIDNVTVNWKRRRARFRLSGYKDEQARIANVSSAVMAERQYQIKGDEFDLVFGLLEPESYPAFDATASYEAGKLVSFESSVYRADTAITADGSNPDSTTDWIEASKLEISRTEAYRHVKGADIDFVDATRA